MPSLTPDSRHWERPLLHLQLGLRPLVLADGEVQPDVDDGDQVEEEEGGDQQEWLRHHGAVGIREAERSDVSTDTQLRLTTDSEDFKKDVDTFRSSDIFYLRV